MILRTNGRKGNQGDLGWEETTVWDRSKLLCLKGARRKKNEGLILERQVLTKEIVISGRVRVENEVV